MKYLWLTWTDPFLENDGQRTYSGRLIEAAAHAGAEIEVLCLASYGSPRVDGISEGTIRWRLVRRTPRPGWRSILSPLPNIAYRCDTGEMRRGLHGLLERHRWGTIVVDGLSAGWALPSLERLRAEDGRPPRIVYISHNHEETVRADMARNYRGNPVKKGILLNDAGKAQRLERRLVAHADIVTAITPEDAELFSRRHPDKRIIVLPPGYAGPRLAQRRITAALPRHAVILGTFAWLAKRMNLEEFVAVADPHFERAGAELQVIGDGDPALIHRLRGTARATRFAGFVPDIEPYLTQSRVAVVPERSGGGFKMKILDYVFHRLPVAALKGSVAGTPLRPSESILLYNDLDELARGVVQVLDDLPLLNDIQDRAYAACADRFDWRRRGEQFIAETYAA